MHSYGTTVFCLVLGLSCVSCEQCVISNETVIDCMFGVCSTQGCNCSSYVTGVECNQSVLIQLGRLWDAYVLASLVVFLMTLVYSGYKLAEYSYRVRKFNMKHFTLTGLL